MTTTNINAANEIPAGGYVDYALVYAILEQEGVRPGRVADHSHVIWCESRGYRVRFTDVTPEGWRPAHTLKNTGQIRK